MASWQEEVENLAQQEGWDLKWMADGRVQISYHKEAYEYNQALTYDLPKEAWGPLLANSYLQNKVIVTI